MAEKKQALAVPISSLVLRDKPAVDKSAPPRRQEGRGGRLRRRRTAGSSSSPVGKGITGGMMIEITSGLKESQDIVTGPYASLRELKDGVLIKTDAKKESKTS